MRRTKQTVAVLDILARSNSWVHGYEIIQETGLKAGTLYPILNRLVLHKLLVRKYERISPSTAGRPPRIYYRITIKGRTQAAIWRES